MCDFCFSECYNEFFIKGEMEITIVSDGYPFHLQPFSICQWSISTEEDNYLKVSIRDLDLCYNQDDCQTTCLQIGKTVKHCSGSSERTDYLIQSNSTFIILNTTNALGGRGFNVSVKAIGKYRNTYHVDKAHCSPSFTVQCKVVVNRIYLLQELIQKFLNNSFWCIFLFQNYEIFNLPVY